MKNLSLILSSLLLFVSLNTSAQTKKIGHIDSNKLLAAMPGKDSIETKLENYQKSLENQLKLMIGEYQTKEQDFKNQMSNMSELIKQTKQKELEDLVQRINNFQQQAEDDYKKKEQELLTPLINKAKEAINEVAKENGYKYIFDSSLGFILFTDDTDDILPLVKKKLNIK